MRTALLVCLLFLFSPIFSQNEDTSTYTLFKDRLVLYTDLGFSAAPFSIHNDFSDGIKKIRYKHNITPTVGIGVIYKWFAIRFSAALPGTMKPKSRFGDMDYIDLGFSFSLKKSYWDFDLRDYTGYAAMNAYKWNDSLNSLHPNDILPKMKAASLSINMWRFKSKDFKMNAVLGKTGHYNKEEKTWYLKGTLNFFGIANDGKRLMPLEIIDTNDTKNNSNAITAMDIGLVPGYAYVNRINNWQFSGFGGLGGVVQAKFYATDQLTRGFLGLAPRIDLRFVGGYSKTRYFFWFVTDFDVKSIRHQELRYNQTFYTLRAIAGIRFDKKKEKSSKKDQI